MQASNADASK
ncbi:Protein of unknown function [Propionibacterium freudenreichii]|nr:Protein of unknown function [Propionibacterium freudenreichii]